MVGLLQKHQYKQKQIYSALSSYLVSKTNEQKYKKKSTILAASTPISVQQSTSER